MTRIPIEVGREVISRCGRDEGRRFVVIGEIDDEFVLVADGGLRTLDRPKKKRRRHLQGTEYLHATLHDKLTDGKPIFDHEVRFCLSHKEG